MTYGCKHICRSIFFHPFVIESCCSVSGGLFFQKGSEPFNFENVKNKYFEFMNTFKKGIIPECCNGCHEIEKDFDFSKIKNVKIERFYISNWLHCNAHCIYCVYNFLKSNTIYKKTKSSDTYDCTPILKKKKKKDLIYERPMVFIMGGEPTILKELPEIIQFFRNINARFFQIYSSGIKYSKAIHDLLKSDTMTELIISPDSGRKDLYYKIKRVDKFDVVIKNIKKYQKDIQPHNKLIAKYICIKDVNDNKKDLKEWIQCMHETGIKNIITDIDSNYPDKKNSIVPELFNFAKQQAEKLDLNLIFTPMTENNLKNNEIIS